MHIEYTSKLFLKLLKYHIYLVFLLFCCVILLILIYLGVGCLMTYFNDSFPHALQVIITVNMMDPPVAA